MDNFTSQRDSSRRELLRLALAGAAASLVTPATALAQQSTRKAAEDLVTESAIALEEMMAAKDEPAMAKLAEFIDRSRAIIVFPAVFKGGFILGGEGGNGVMIAKGIDGSWSSPAFYILAAGSIGLQAGGQLSKLCFTIMTDGGLDAILENNFKVGGDLSVAVGPFGAGAEASTTSNLDADIYSFSTAMGLFGGGAFEGAALLERKSYMESYYGTKVSAREIIVDRKFFNAQSNRLRAAVG